MLCLGVVRYSYRIFSLFDLTWFDVIWQYNSVGIITVGIQIRYLSTSYTLRIQTPGKKVGCRCPGLLTTSFDTLWNAMNIQYTTPIPLPIGKWGNGMGPPYWVQRSERNPQLRLHLRCCIGNSPFAACSAVRRKKGRSTQRGFARFFPPGKTLEESQKTLNCKLKGMFQKMSTFFFQVSFTS